jgi:hypothetical protein
MSLKLLIKLHALGCVNFADLREPFWIVMRAGDNTCLLSRDEERVLSAIPREYATDATKIRLAAHMPEIKAQQILERSPIRRFIEVSDGARGIRVYRITIAGSKHPQYSQSARRAQAPRLPVESDRIYQVLSAILDSGELRIRDVSTTLRIPNQPMDALMAVSQTKAFR